jgi:hypothetical protein
MKPIIVFISLATIACGCSGGGGDEPTPSGGQGGVTGGTGGGAVDGSGATASGGTGGTGSGVGLYENLADQCGGFGHDCTNRCSQITHCLAPATFSVCEPPGRTIGGVRCGTISGYDCPAETPLCLPYQDISGGICVTQGEWDCVCQIPNGQATYVCTQ